METADRLRSSRAKRSRTAVRRHASAGQRMGEKGQALVHPVIDAAMVVGELLVAMRNAKLAQLSHKPACTVKQVELILLAAVDVERLQPAEVVRLGFNRDNWVVS